jgi:RNA polymerase sigma-B factor
MRRAPHRCDEQELLRRYADGDLSARTALAERYMPLARSHAGRYHHSSEPRDDLEQVAFVGLLKAIDRYEPGAGRFTNYAAACIGGELKRYFRDHGWGLRVSRRLKERWLAVRGALEVLPASLGHSPTPAEVARHTGLSRDEVLEAMDAGRQYRPSALDAPGALNEDGPRTWGEGLGGEDAGFELVNMLQSIGPVWRGLAERDREILRRSLLADQSQAEIGAHFGISQMQVSRLMRRALATLSAGID